MLLLLRRAPFARPAVAQRTLASAPPNGAPVLSKDKARSIMNKIRASMRADQPKAAPLGSGGGVFPTDDDASNGAAPTQPAQPAEPVPMAADSVAALRSLQDDVRAAEQRAAYRLPPLIQKQLDEKLADVQVSPSTAFRRCLLLDSPST